MTFRVDQAIKSEPSSEYAGKKMKEVATEYNPDELRAFRKEIEGHWEKIKDDPSANADLKKFCLHAVEKIQGKKTTWKEPVKQRVPIPRGFGPNER